ncbi:MAG: peptide MFS transporter [Bacteroidales bacterium]|nr:peptide MFS transporter [Bacteroidales bacterium]MBD5205675.1 peptide MFS transporter [Bacteroidales bacterium]MBD5224033.1 peptide MFS transporter [Bacteroidales bacterium]
MFKNHPKGLIPAALSNMGERFGYYIMNAVLVLFLCSKFGLKEETASIVYSCFYAGIYILGLVGGLIADKTQNYKSTIIWGLIVMTLGYVVLAFPIFATAENQAWLLTLTCFALFMIAFGNGLFKGNLQAIVGQLYDNPRYASQRDAGFQIFYVFINIGGVLAPFVAPMLRSWWLGENGLAYNASLPALCHEYLSVTDNMSTQNLNNLYALITEVGGDAAGNIQEFCSTYLNVFNTGIHYSFIASVAAMLISLFIFIGTKKMLPTPAKKAAEAIKEYSQSEKTRMASEIRQRMYALFAVLGIAIFFWFSFHQNGTSLSLFARDFVKTDSVSPEIWQALNPFYVIILTPFVMMFFGWLSRRGKEISTPRKIAIGMGLAGIAYLFLVIFSAIKGYPSADEFKALPAAVAETMKTGPWVLFVLYFFLTVAELFISPLGLSFVSKVAPKHLQGLCQGLWLGATAVGNLLLWIGPLIYNACPIWVAWTVFLSVCAVSMGVMYAMVGWLERVTK